MCIKSSFGIFVGGQIVGILEGLFDLILLAFGQIGNDVLAFVPLATLDDHITSPSAFVRAAYKPFEPSIRHSRPL